MKYVEFNFYNLLIKLFRKTFLGFFLFSSALVYSDTNNTQNIALPTVEEFVQIIVDKGLDINMTDDRGHTLLHLAIIAHYSTLVHLIVQNEKRYRRTRTTAEALPFNISTESEEFKEFLSGAHWLIPGGVSLPKKEERNSPNYIETRFKELLDILDEIMNSELNVSQRALDTFLDDTIGAGLKAFASFLIQVGANEIQNKKIPEEYYTMESSLKEKIEEAFSNPWNDIRHLRHVLDTKAIVPLYYALEVGSYRLIKALIKAGANINAQNELKEAPLHFAVKKDLQRIVKLLIQEEADVNIQDYKRNTPLEYAKPEVALLLIEHEGTVIDRNMFSGKECSPLPKDKTTIPASIEKEVKTIAGLCELETHEEKLKALEKSFYRIQECLEHYDNLSYHSYEVSRYLSSVGLSYMQAILYDEDMLHHWEYTFGLGSSILSHYLHIRAVGFYYRTNRADTNPHTVYDKFEYEWEYDIYKGFYCFSYDRPPLPYKTIIEVGW